MELKKEIKKSFVLHFNPLVKLWKRVGIEFKFLCDAFPRYNDRITYKSRLGLAKALRLVALKGIKHFHFSFTEDYYKMLVEERVKKYISLIHTMILIDHTPENGFTPIESIDESLS